jgi:hypothetical protein
MFKVLAGLTTGFVVGAVYGVQFAVQIPDSNLIKMIRIVKLLWKVAQA